MDEKLADRFLKNRGLPRLLLLLSIEVVLLPVFHQNAFQYICNVAEAARRKRFQAPTIWFSSRYVIVHRKRLCRNIVYCWHRNTVSRWRKYKMAAPLFLIIQYGRCLIHCLLDTEKVLHSKGIQPNKIFVLGYHPGWSDGLGAMLHPNLLKFV